MEARSCDRWDYLLVFAILATLLVFLRTRHSPEAPAKPWSAHYGSAGMDGLWRDAVAPQKKTEDLRPPADADIVWNDRVLIQPAPAPRRPAPAAEAAPAPAPEAYAPPPPAAKPAAKPKLEPTRYTLTGERSRAKSSAFLAYPK